MSQLIIETPTAIQRTVHKGYHEHRIRYSERILLFPMWNYVLKLINNILNINEVKETVTYQACSLSHRKDMDVKAQMLG